MTRISLVVAVAAASVGLAGFTLMALDRRAGPPIVIEDPLLATTLVVSVSGAVASPGLYTLAAGARVADALVAAGGTTSAAAVDAVNPARRLRDEEQLVVPQRGGDPSPPAVIGATEPSAVAGATEPTAAASDTRPSTPLDLNTASEAELERLPEIGPTLAARIVAQRQAQGPFRAVEELATIEGISPRMVDTLRPLVTVAS